jgi:hypothetical protein
VKARTGASERARGVPMEYAARGHDSSQGAATVFSFSVGHGLLVARFGRLTPRNSSTDRSRAAWSAVRTASSGFLSLERVLKDSVVRPWEEARPSGIIDPAKGTDMAILPWVLVGAGPAVLLSARIGRLRDSPLDVWSRTKRMDAPSWAP